MSERQPLPSRDLSFRRSDYAVISIPIIKVAYRICHESQKKERKAMFRFRLGRGPSITPTTMRRKSRLNYKILTRFDLSEISGYRATEYPEIQRNEGRPKAGYELPQCWERRC